MREPSDRQLPSALIQVEEDRESQRRQYELAHRAREIGFRDIVVIDDDLEISCERP